MYLCLHSAQGFFLHPSHAIWKAKEKVKKLYAHQKKCSREKNATLMEKQHRKVRVLSFYHAIIVGVVS
jgi:hypothetical protein